MKRGFALMELPIVLFVMFGVGLFVAFVYSLFSGPAPWYAWLICGLIPPVTFLLVGSIGELIVDPKKPKEDKIHNQTSGAGEDD